MSFLAVLLAGAPSQGGANPIVTFLPLVLIFIVFYFFIIRPQKKKEDQRKKLIESAKKGDRVITIGGLHGTISQVDDSSVLVQVDTNTKIRVEKHAIAAVVTKDQATTPTTTPAA